MNFISPNWPAPPSIRALSTTRIGGVSKGVYSALNLGDHVDDDPNSVAKNREILKLNARLPSEPVWLDQIHGTRVVEATPLSKLETQTADGVWTNSSGVVCAILTADCLPLLLTNRKGNRVAAVHAGWRSLAAGIIEHGVNVFNEDPKDIFAWAGPCIGPATFEVGIDVMAELGGPKRAYLPSQSPGKVLANLALLAQTRLADIGVTEFYSSEQCTFSNPERYFSYRRDGQCGRMASLIWIDAAGDSK